MSLLADSLKGLASISLQTLAEQTFAIDIVRPYMNQVCVVFVSCLAVHHLHVERIFSFTFDMQNKTHIDDSLCIDSID
jgi:hypothetical protein